MTFAQTRIGNDGQVSHEEEVSVTMAPAQFKLFAQLCSGLVVAFENTQAPIAIPQGAGNPNVLDPQKLLDSLAAAKAKLDTKSKVGSTPSGGNPSDSGHASSTRKSKKKAT